MDKNDGAEKKLLRPAAALKSKASSTNNVSGEANRTSSESTNKSVETENGSSPSITEDFMKKISTNVMSPLTANRPGRLASFRPERDLTLGALVKPLTPSTAVASAAAQGGGTKSKKNFAPTIPTRRGKIQEEKTEEKATNDRSPSQRGRGRKDDSSRGRGRGRGKPELIQTSGSVFGEGISAETQKRTSSSGSWGKEPSANSIAKPSLNLQNLNKKIDKDVEDAKLKELLRDDFIDDGHDHDDLSSVPIQLPKTNTSTFLKKDVESESVIESSPAPQYVGDVAIKQEKTEEPATTIELKAEKTYHRRKAPSHVNAADLFKRDEDMIFFQLPDMLPSLKADKEKERPEIKVEPGKGKANKPTEELKVTDKDSDKSKDLEGTLGSLPEGRLGTLRIHQSGKVTMQLGDHTFVVDSGTQVSYVQDLISVNVDSGTKTGNMTALGPIRFKAVCLPDWEQLVGDT